MLVVSNLFLFHKTDTRLKTEDYQRNDDLLSSPLVSHLKLNIDHPMKLPIFPRSAEILFPRCERSGIIPRCADSCFPRTEDFWPFLFFPRTVGNPFYSASESPASIAARLHLLFRRLRRSSSEIWWDFPSPLFLSPFFPFCVSLFLLCRPPPPPPPRSRRRRGADNRPMAGTGPLLHYLLQREKYYATLTTAHLQIEGAEAPLPRQLFLFVSAQRSITRSWQRTKLAMRLANPNWFTIRGRL